MASSSSYSAGLTPRPIPTGMAIRVQYFSSASVGCLLLMAIFGLLTYFFVDWREVANSWAFSTSDPVVTGVADSVIRTNSKVNGTRIYEIRFSYSVDGKRYSSTCYGSQYQNDTDDTQIIAGQPVQVQYTTKNPALAVVVGKDRQAMPFFVAVIFALFFLGGVLGLLHSIRIGTRNLALITNGVLTSGKLINKQEVVRRRNSGGGTSITYVLTFEFSAKDGQKHQTVVRTKDMSRLTDESEERLVYDETNPKAAVLIDSLPLIVRKFFEALA